MLPRRRATTLLIAVLAVVCMPAPAIDTPPAGVSATYSRTLIVAPVAGGVATIPVNIHNGTKSPQKISLAGGKAFSLNTQPSTCTGTATGGFPGTRTLAAAEKLTLMLTTPAQTSAGVCYESWWLYVDGSAAATFGVAQVTVPPGWYNTSTDFDATDSFDGFKLGGTTLESQPAGTCAIGSTSAYGTFYNFGGKSIVCWGDALILHFGPNVTHAGFTGAGPAGAAFREEGFSIRSTFEWPRMGSSEGDTRGVRSSLGRMVFGNTNIPDWVEAAAFISASDYGTPEPFIKQMRISHPDHQPFIVDDLAILTTTPPTTPPKPTVISVTPSQAPPGTPIEIYGSGFLSGGANGSVQTTELLPPLVRIGGMPAEVVSTTSMTIKAVVPELAFGTAAVEVTTADGRTSGSVAQVFTVGNIPPRRRSVGH